MRSLPLIAACLVISTAAPALAQQQPRLGQRTGSPEQMVARMSPVSPEEEMRALVAAADAHPLGTLENPVRVGGPDGERAYLARLRCADGTAPRIGARREAGVGAFGSVAGAYEVACAAAGRIVFDMYHEEHVETRAPAGFTLQP
ncbi:MAG TPA: hypothetical protein VEX35_10810 [Allosphingosinicella sp.]|nr:hypothetical protein [Allosphingosinicella sp.]